jgi:hypothetical protein
MAKYVSIIRIFVTIPLFYFQSDHHFSHVDDQSILRNFIVYLFLTTYSPFFLFILFSYTLAFKIIARPQVNFLVWYLSTHIEMSYWTNTF